MILSAMDGPGGVPTTMLFCQPPTASLPCRFHFSYAGQSIQVLPLSSAVLSLYLNKPFYCRQQRSVLLGTCVDPGMASPRSTFSGSYTLFFASFACLSESYRLPSAVTTRLCLELGGRKGNGTPMGGNPPDTIDTFHDLSVHD